MSKQRNEIFQGPESNISEAEKRFSMAQNDWLEKEFGFKTHVCEVPLPSEGKLYPESHPLHMVESVEFLPMGTKEEDIIRNKRLIENKTMGNELIRSCLVNKQIDPKTLFSGDALAILYAIRAASYGPEYVAKTKCVACGKVQKVKINLEELEIKPLSEDVVPGTNVFSTVLPVTKIKVEYRLLNEDEASKVSEENEVREKKGIAAASSTIAMQHLLVSVNGITDRGKVNMFATRMPSQDALHVRKEVAKHEPGVNNKYLFSCENLDCRHEAMQGIPFGIEFWMPEADV